MRDIYIIHFFEISFTLWGVLNLEVWGVGTNNWCFLLRIASCELFQQVCFRQSLSKKENLFVIFCVLPLLFLSHDNNKWVWSIYVLKCCNCVCIVPHSFSLCVHKITVIKQVENIYWMHDIYPEQLFDLFCASLSEWKVFCVLVFLLQTELRFYFFFLVLLPKPRCDRSWRTFISHCVCVCYLPSLTLIQL